MCSNSGFETTTPALLTRIDSGPSSVSAVATAAATLVGRVTSQAIGRHLSARRFDLAGRLGEAIDPPRGERHLGAGGGEQLGEVTADPARRTGDERHLATEVEAR